LLLRLSLLLLLLGQSTLASAQDSSATPPSAAEPAPELRKKEPMDMFAFGLKLGFSHVSGGTIENPTYIPGAERLPREQLEKYGLISARGCDPIDRTCHTASRPGYFLAIPIQFGGSGVGFRAEPYIGWNDSFGALGVYAGPTFEFHVAEPFYLGFGFGLRFAYVVPQHWEYAMELYGRIPVWGTFYLTDTFALVAEFAFGAGVSGYVSEVQNVYNPVDMKLIGYRRDLTYGWGRSWDMSIGVRFP
jgi:hypothetical protein